MYIAIDSNDMVVSEGETLETLMEGLIDNDFDNISDINNNVTFYLVTKVNIRAVKSKITLEGK